MTDFTPFRADDAVAQIAVPVESDDKYSRGVLGIITGSDQYPGAAVLGVDAALHTGVGMVRYLGGERASTLVLQRRPEAVAGEGRVQAWLIGSGMDHAARDDATRAQTARAMARVVCARVASSRPAWSIPEPISQACTRPSPATASGRRCSTRVDARSPPR